MSKKQLTFEEFEKGVKQYWGEWDSKHLRLTVKEYIETEINPLKYGYLLRYLQYYHPRNFGAPDIAAIINAMDLAIIKKTGESIIKPVITQIQIDKITEEQEREVARLFMEDAAFQELKKKMLQFEEKQKSWKTRKRGNNLC